MLKDYKTLRSVIYYMVLLPVLSFAQGPVREKSFTKNILIDNPSFSFFSFQENTNGLNGGITMETWNLGLRFILELSALTSMGFWGYENGTGALRYALMAGVPLAAAAAWGIFAVQGDPSRSGNTVVATPGYLRLLLELSFFGFSVWTLQDMGSKTLAWTMGGTVVFHYAFSYKRILWLLDQSLYL